VATDDAADDLLIERAAHLGSAGHDLGRRSAPPAQAPGAAALEAALSKGFSSASLTGASVPAKDLNSDLHASAEYRAHLITVMAKRAVDAAK